MNEQVSLLSMKQKEGLKTGEALHYLLWTPHFIGHHTTLLQALWPHPLPTLSTHWLTGSALSPISETRLPALLLSWARAAVYSSEKGCVLGRRSKVQCPASLAKGFQVAGDMENTSPRLWRAAGRQSADLDGPMVRQSTRQFCMFLTLL